MKGVKRMKEWEFRNKTLEVLQRCLMDIPFVGDEITIRVKESAEEAEPEYVAEFDCGEGKKQLVVETKSRGEPRLARAAIDKLRGWLEQYPDAYPVFMAPYIGPRAAQICRSAQVGYIDLAGNCYLSIERERIHVVRDGCENPYVSGRRLKTLYSRKASRILRVLLCSPGKAWRMKDLAEEAGASIGLVHNVKKLLWEKEWLEETSDGLVLADRASVLSGWTENYTVAKSEGFEFYSHGGIPEIEEKLGEACEKECVEYGFTGFSAAARWAPPVRYKRVDAYVREDFVDVAERTGFKGVDSGGNVRLFVPYDDGVFYGSEVKEGARIVCAVQAYLDLAGMSGRAAEAAQQVLRGVVMRAGDES